MLRPLLFSAHWFSVNKSLLDTFSLFSQLSATELKELMKNSTIIDNTFSFHVSPIVWKSTKNIQRYSPQMILLLSSLLKQPMKDFLPFYNTKKSCECQSNPKHFKIVQWKNIWAKFMNLAQKWVHWTGKGWKHGSNGPKWPIWVKSPAFLSF